MENASFWEIVEARLREASSYNQEDTKEDNTDIVVAAVIAAV